MPPRVATISNKTPIFWLEHKGSLKVLVPRPLDHTIPGCCTSNFTKIGAKASKYFAVFCFLGGGGPISKAEESNASNDKKQLASKLWKYCSRKPKNAQEAPAQPV